MYTLGVTTVKVKNNKEAVSSGNVVKEKTNEIPEHLDPSGNVEKEVRMEQAAESFYPSEIVAKEQIERNLENSEEAGPSGIVVENEVETDEAADSNLTYNEHLEESVEKFYQCGACETTFAKYDDLKQHVKKVRKDTNHPILTSFNCLKCKKSFAKADKLNRHVLTHTGKKTHECPECPKRFLRKDMLNEHMVIHLDVKPFQCTNCKKRFAKNQHLKEHWRRIHKREKPHECHVCNLSVSASSAFRRHVSKYGNKKHYKCEVCPGEKIYTSKHSLALHMRIHNMEKVHKCFKCDMRFMNEYQMTVHEQIHL